jgi:hypothetical protein
MGIGARSARQTLVLAHRHMGHWWHHAIAERSYVPGTGAAMALCMA